MSMLSFMNLNTLNISYSSLTEYVVRFMTETLSFEFSEKKRNLNLLQFSSKQGLSNMAWIQIQTC